MIRGMTGFGDASATIGGTHYFIEVRALNSKYFKANVRLPEEFQPLEAEIETEIRRVVHRGTVTCSASVSASDDGAAFEVNHKAIEDYVAQLERAEPVASGRVAIEISALLALPGVVAPRVDEEERLRAAREALLPLLRRALERLISVREREGAALQTMLGEQRELIADRLEQIKHLAPTVVRIYEDRLHDRLKALLDRLDVAAGPADLIREVAVFAEKADIAEEVMRLGEHLSHLGDLLDRGDGQPIGRTIDFLAQELLREANTIASKSPDAAISRLTVEIKGAIDRIKEQAQNVE